MINHFKGLLISVGLGISLFTAVDSYAQTLARHNWYFGNTQRSIHFNRVTNAPSLIDDKAAPFGTGGSAVATERGSGNLLFYTDGEQVFDTNNQLMPNGGGLNANKAANQPVAITPVPGQPGKYFIFTNTANFTTGGAISYSVVDMNLFGKATFPSPAFGDVESKNNAIPTLVNVAEGMITLPHDNGRDFWLITQTVNSQFFNATLINGASYTANTFNTVTSNGSALPTTIAHFAYHEGLRKLAAAPQDASTDAIILDFNEANGAINFDRTILNSGVLSTTNQAIYDIEWSENGQYLYLSRHGEAGVNADVIQYDYQNAAITLASVLPAPIFRSYGLQRGPDSRIYHLFQASAAGPFLLGRIDHPDSVASKAAYTSTPASFAGLNFDGKQFPGFLPKDTITLNLDFTFSGTCQNSPTTFYPFVRPGADSLQWNFGDGNSASAWSPIHTYETAGSFNVVMRAYYQGQVDSVSHSVPIQSFALTLQLEQETTACREEFPPPRGSSSPQQFSVKLNIQGGSVPSSNIVWSNGDLGDTLTPDSAGYYYVVVTDAGGCTGYAGVNVKEYGLQTTTFNKWYFGNKAGIDFTTGDALAESAMDAPEGCAIVCDRNGQQIFYTDGSTVWDKTHTVIATSIGGNPRAAQSALIVPVPGDETIYYIFTTQDFNGSDSLQLKYSVFDLKQNSGKGAVVKQDVLMYMRNTERITANGQYLIVHELGNSLFRSYPITAEGIGNPRFSDTGTKNSAELPKNADGYMKLGPRDLVAVPISSPGVSAKIDLLHLNDTTGVVNLIKTIDLNDPAGSVYGIEFSPTGNKLFASVKYASNTSSIYEYSIDSLFRPKFRQKIPVAAELGAIQIGPDGQIYVAVNNSGNNTSLGIITANEDTLATSGFNLNGFPLAGGTNSWLGLPNFVQQNSNALGGPGITVTGLCSGDSTRFSGSPRDQIDEFKWSVFRGGSLVASSTEATFAALLPGPGDYSVTLQLHNRCAADTTMAKNFKISPPPANPTRGVPLCNTPTVDLDANPTNVAGLTYAWATGETTEILTVGEPGVYEVEITDALGCTTTGQFLTADSRPIFDLGPDITVCEDQNTPALNVMNPGMTYAWTINGTPASTTAVQAVDTNTPGVFDYAVTVTDPVTSCFRTEDKEYTVNVSPAIAMNGTNPTSCNTPTGSISLTLNTSVPAGGPLYQYFITGPTGLVGDGLDQTAPNTFTVNNVVAGTYTGIVVDQVSGCQSQAAFGLTDAAFTATISITGPNCDPVLLHAALAGAPPTFPVNWTTTNSANGATTTGTENAALAFDMPPGVPGGSYVIEFKDNGGCILTVPFDVTPNPKTAITLTPDLCAMTLAATSTATSYTWTPASGIVTPTTGPTIQLVPNAGLVTYTAVSSGGPSCPGTETITLNVQAVPTPVLTQSTACAEFATIDVNPDGNFTYRWFRDGVFTNAIGGATASISRPDNGHTYAVQIFEPQSGCTKDSGTLTAEVVGIVDASLTSTPPCDDGQPITLTAITTETTGASYEWSLNDAVIAGVTTPETDQTAEGTYKVKISRGSCDATASLLIKRAALPVSSLNPRAIICDDPENTDETTKQVALDPGNFVEYVWEKNEVLLNYTERVYTADSKGIYAVTITDANGCKNRAESEVLNDCLPKVAGPNAFRPGSENAIDKHPELNNANFWLLTRFIEEDNFKVFIFNRWGEMVYSSTDRYFKWNGGYNNDLGRPLPPGTYSYVVQYVGSYRQGDGVKEKRGGVALIR